MPISSPSRAVPEPPKGRAAPKRLALCLLTAFAASAPAQTLARPGWMGSSLNADPWGQHAVFYEIHEPDFKVISTKLEALRSLGIDAVLVPMPSVTPDPTLNDFDELILQASQRGIRVLLTLPATGAAPDVSSLARFWLNRGVAGFHITTPPGSSSQDTQAIVQAVRALTSSAIGQRIVLSDLNTTPPDTATAVPATSSHHAATRHTAQPVTPAGAQLQIDSRIGSLATLDATSLRPLLAQTLTQRNVLLDVHPPNPDSQLAKALATILLTLHPAAVIDAATNLTLPSDELPTTEPTPPQPASPPPPAAPAPAPGTYVPYVAPGTAAPGTYAPYVPYVPNAPTPHPTPSPTPQPSPADPLTDWYRQLSQLHHANAVLRLGIPALVDFDQQNALVWVVRPATASALTPPIVVACNLSSAPVQLSIGAAIKSLNLHGTYLRTLLRSDKAMGPQDLNGVILPPFAVYIGELHR